MTEDIVWVHAYHEPEKDGVIADGTSNDLASIYDEDDWEDQDFVESIHNKFPNWYLVKMLGFNASTMTPVEEWCNANVKFGSFKKVGWDSGCSYSVGVVFESSKDAMMFKLRWR